MTKVVLSWFLFLLAIPLQAGQVRTITEPAYSTSQAGRGQPVYTAQCQSCHGDAMQGSIGPPLAGDSFLAKWSARPLTAFVDKIQKTMPFGRVGTLSREQSIDLTAYILQGGKFPAGQSDLSE